jgi:site-specific recombinase XerD
MQIVTLKPLHHRQQECIGIYFENSLQLNTAIRKNAGARWSQTNKCWYILLSKENYNRLFFALKGKAEIEQSALHKYLTEKKKKVQGTESTVKGKSVITKQPSTPEKKTVTAKPVWISKQVTVYKTQKIKDINAHVLPAMEQHLKLKAYSPSTIKTYLGEMVQLLSLLNTIPADDLKPEHLKRYLLHCYEKLKLTENTLHSRINAMKFYYEQVLGREKFFWEIPRPKKQYILPKVLGESELKRLFTALLNKKHKAILFTAYSAGLRVSEVVNLELRHIDRSRMQLLIKNAKGKKDRYVMLSPLLIDILTNYYKTCKPRPAKYVFEGPEPGTPYSSSSMQKIFQVARKNAGIQKQVSFHSLRHSFATHLLEKGVDIKYIRDLLGHFDIKTTARYLHVKREQLVNIESPLDGLMSKEEI